MINNSKYKFLTPDAFRPACVSRDMVSLTIDIRLHHISHLHFKATTSLVNYEVKYRFDCSSAVVLL